MLFGSLLRISGRDNGISAEQMLAQRREELRELEEKDKG